jgi:GT2 family glycosyltransferase
MVSAIIPTHNRLEPLRVCLETLQRQTVAAHELEVVVVDDGSSEDVAGVVAGAAGAGPIPLRLERQPPGGLNSARNRGAAVTSGEILAFLDDDTLVSPGWAASVMQTFASHPCAGIGGRIELALDGPMPPWVADRRHFLSEYQLGPAPRWLTADDPVPVGANCAVRRTDFDRAGGFVAGLDRIGASLVSNGDTEFFRRVRAAGGRLRYDPSAAVIHCVPANRLTVDFWLRRHRDQGVSDEYLFALEGGRITPGYRWMLTRGSVGVLGTLARDLAAGRGPLNARLWASYWRGRWASAGRLPAELTGIRPPLPG